MIGGIGGFINGLSSGRKVVNPASGGNGVEGGGETGTIGFSGGGKDVDAIGGFGVDGVSLARAEHFKVGFPVVPGGHVHNGR